MVKSELRLDRILGITYGVFVWLGTDFHLDTKDFWLVGTVLRATPRKGLICPQILSVNLDDRISNKWGSLCYADGGLGFFSPRGTPNEDKKDAEFIPHVGFLPCDDLARRQWDAKEIHRVEVKRMEAEKALEVLPPFKHPPLPSASDIRLLRIGDSNDTSDILRCSLVVVDLKKNPAFDALSYTWGNPFAEPRVSVVSIRSILKDL